MAIFTLNAVPAIRNKPVSGFTSTTMNLMASVIPRRQVEARNTAELAAHAYAFGTEAAQQPKGTSFVIMVCIARGHRKFRGFDAANDRKEFHNETWLRSEA